MTLGSDVIVVHRLLKNHVADSLGLSAYALYTDALVQAMGLRDPAAAGMRAHRESFESVGEIAGWVSDLGSAWRERLKREGKLRQEGGSVRDLVLGQTETR